MVIDLPLLTGVIGMLLVLLGFIMIQTHRWSPDDMAYDMINLIGSALLVIYGYIGQVWPFVILNGVFVVYSLREVLVDLTTKKPRR